MGAKTRLMSIRTSIENIIETIGVKSNREKYYRLEGMKYGRRSQIASAVRGAILGGILGYLLSPEYAEITVTLGAIGGAVIDSVQNSLRMYIVGSKLYKDQKIREMIREEIAKPGNTKLGEIIREEIVKYHQANQDNS